VVDHAAPTGRKFLSLLGLHPVLQRKARHSPELALVVGHQHRLDLAGVRGDQKKNG
jgi:hypothetical protein